jgi:hypothetical protein
MPEGRQDFSRIFGEIKQEFFRFADSYAEAVSSGANVTGKKIVEAVENSVQPPDILIGKLILAVKSGVQDAGEQMIKSGMDFAQHRKEKAKKQ